MSATRARGWLPDLADIAGKITERTRAIVLINPNNPTGALYPTDLLREIVELARRHQLIVFADEIYDKTLYDGATHTSIASLADDVLFVTFNGLSKNYRACGYRSGWMVLSGDKRHAQDYIEGLNILASMRLCANVPGQFAIQTALGGYQSINDLVAPGGRLARQRDLAYDMLTSIPGVTCVKPKAALYLFPRLDPKRYPIGDDEKFVLALLEEEHVLVVQGTGFNWPEPDHFRVVFLPNSDDLGEAFGASPISSADIRAATAHPEMKPINVALLGLGTVASAPGRSSAATRRKSRAARGVRSASRGSRKRRSNARARRRRAWPTSTSPTTPTPCWRTRTSTSSSN
jgi:alanine-synthesizing transaminase